MRESVDSGRPQSIPTRKDGSGNSLLGDSYLRKIHRENARMRGCSICRAGSINCDGNDCHPFKDSPRCWRITLDGILNYCRTKVRFGVVEAINGNIKTLLTDSRII